jgi:hypothetical protein
VAGDVHATVTLSLASVLVTPDGASGAPMGVTAVEAEDAEVWPYESVAVTSKE